MVLFTFGFASAYSNSKYYQLCLLYEGLDRAQMEFIKWRTAVIKYSCDLSTVKNVIDGPNIPRQQFRN